MRAFDSLFQQLRGGIFPTLLLLWLIGSPLAARQIPPARIQEHVQTVTVSPNGKFTLQDRLVITIFRSEAADLAKLQVPYSSSIKVKNMAGTVHDLLGNTLYKFKKSDVEDFSNFSSFSIYEDNRVKVLDLRQTQYPYTATLEFEIELPNLYYVPNWVPQRYPSIPVEKASITYQYPKETEIRFLSRHLEEARHAQRQEGKLQVQSWEIGPLSAYTPEPMAVLEEQRKPMLLASPGKFSFDGNSGDLSSWEEMGRWFYALNADKRELSAQTKADVHALVAGLPDDVAKAEASTSTCRGGPATSAFSWESAG
ncbi:DUF3857 domain-containing protein [Nitritalea halalkaliphila]|uniref:DUF3857 domain-containing protein n=1 Tax=Nitritalea halalkaliphila TaxID=590849 RepID=UPI0003027507|nr:DUF3857 domain-containing protein [Nitritalea halalkaliphila]